MSNRYSIDLEASSTQYGTDADNATNSPTGDISIESWIKLETAGGCVLSKYNEQGNQRSFYLTVGSELTFRFSSNGESSPGSYTISSSGAGIALATWTHIAVTLDVSAKTVKFYKNAQLLSNGTPTDNSPSGSIYDSSAPLDCGRYQTNGPTTSALFDGKLNNLRLWSDIRTQQEIQDNIRKVLSSGGNLVGSWFSEAADGNDLTSNNLDFSLSGSPVFSSDIPFGNNPGFFAL